MSTHPSRRFDASSLTAGERSMLVERYPELRGATAVAWGSQDSKIIALIEALTDAFATDGSGEAGRFEVAVLTDAERRLLAERHPRLDGHTIEMVCSTDDPAIARVLKSVLVLFGDDSRQQLSGAGIPKQIAKEPRRDNRQDSRGLAPKPLVAVVSESNEPAEQSGDRASWALPDGWNPQP